MTGRSLIPSSSEDSRFKFTGKELDASDGLVYFGARYYDSWKPGWDQVDPMSDDHPSESPYVYCNNNPLNTVDDDGMEGHEETDDHGNKIWVLDEVDTYAYSGTNYVSNATKSAAFLAMGATFDPEPVTKILLGSALISVVGTVAIVKYMHYLQERTQQDATTTYTINPSTNQLPTLQLNEEQTNNGERDYSEHAQEQMQKGKGVSKESVEEAIANGNPEAGNPTKNANSTVYKLPSAKSSTGRGVIVVVNNGSGKVITVTDKGTHYKGN